MTLDTILKNVEVIKIDGETDISIENLAIDSRDSLEQGIFFCIKGINTDGHIFVDKAIENGAKAIVCEDDIFVKNATIIKVKNTRIALSQMCLNFFNNPSGKFDLIGVTGTNGKTSTTFFIESILNEYKKNVGLIGTVQIKINNKPFDFDFKTSTTPDTLELNKLFNKMNENFVDTVVMEVSSHALELFKVEGIKFKVGVFTNLTQDHLDFHKTMKNYFFAKLKLFKMCETGIVNLDDDYSNKIIEESNCKILTFSIENESDLKAINIKYLMDKVEFDVIIDNQLVHFNLNVPGKFSVYNALAAIGTALTLNLPIDIIKKGINSIMGVPGRIQSIKNDKKFNVFVDYAHTPDGLENIIKSVKQFTKGRVITVFGCGGDRDRKKRPIMGEISGKLSDFTIITSDNPRSEVPEDIIKDIEIGINSITNEYKLITSRKDAIFEAVKIAKPFDSIIIAGKGHENYEIFADKIIDFDDTEVAKQALRSL